MELGNKGVFQFLDSNHTLTAVQRSSKHSLFAHALTQIRRCDDMERIVRYLNSEMRRVIDANQDAYLDDDIDDVAINAAMESGRFENIYEDTKRIEGMLRDMASTLNQCTANLNTELERKQVLIAGREFYHLRTNPALDHRGGANGGGERKEGDEMRRILGGHGTDDEVRFNTVAGVIKTSFVSKFRRQLFRSTRGNHHIQTKVIAKSVGLRDPETQAEVDMTVFIIFYRSTAIYDRIGRVIDAFGAHRYTDIPDFSDTEALEENITR
jgi:vacuolar-type H+-ATPase subunit I/STV1